MPWNQKFCKKGVPETTSFLITWKPLLDHFQYDNKDYTKASYIPTLFSSLTKNFFLILPVKNNTQFGEKKPTAWFISFFIIYLLYYYIIKYFKYSWINNYVNY